MNAHSRDLWPDGNADERAAGLFLLVYVLLVGTLLPPAIYPRMIGGMLVCASIFALAARGVRRQGSVPGFSIFAITMISAAVLVVPSFGAMGGRYPDAVWIGFVGSQALAVLWVSLCYRPGPASPRKDFFSVLILSIAAAAVISLVALVPLALLALGDFHEAAKMSLVVPAYFVGALGAGLSYWILQPVRNRPVARYLIGCLGGFFLYAAVGPVVEISDGNPIILSEILGIGAVCGCFVGPSVAFSMGRGLFSYHELTLE